MMTRYFALLSFMIIQALVFAGCASSSGHFVDRGVMAETPFVVGEGVTREEATRNALIAVPHAYETEKDGLRASSCARPGEFPQWSTQQQDYICPSGRYQSSIAVLPLDPIERKQIADYRAAVHGRTKYSGTGADTKAALKDLMAKLPKNAVIDSYSIGCTGEIHVDPINGFTSCGNKPEGNKREATATVIEPNVSKIISVE